MELLAAFTLTMHKYLLIFLLFNATCLSAHAQEEPLVYVDSTELATEDVSDEVFVEEVPDTVLFKRQVMISADTIALLKRKKDFRYMPYLDSLLKKQQEEDEAKLKNAGRSLSFFARIFNAPLLQILFWIIAAGVVLYILTRLFITQGVFRRGYANKEVEEKEEEEKIYTQNDYSKLIQQSCRLGDYRSAVKYLFLRTLQQLADNSWIEYASDKTNYRYLQEIPADKKKEFARLILNYEYIWYGNLHIERTVYEKIESEFTSFQQKI
jgi:hypothetical protein